MYFLKSGGEKAERKGGGGKGIIISYRIPKFRGGGVLIKGPIPPPPINTPREKKTKGPQKF